MIPVATNASNREPSVNETARLQLERILQSESFRGSEANRHLLRFLGDKFLSGESAELKEYSIGIDALGKPSSYDPRFDSNVRVQIGRLRQKLAEYYRTEGAADTFLMEIPKGQLSLECRPIPSKPIADVQELPAASKESGRTADWRRRALVLTVVAAAAVILAALLGFQMWREAQNEVRLGTAWTPELEKLWAPFLDTNRPLKISFESPMFIAMDNLRLFRDTSVNRWSDVASSPEITAVAKALKSQDLQPRYHYSPFQEVNSAFLLGKLLATRNHEASLIRSNQFSWEQMGNANWLFIGSPGFFGEVLEGIPVQRQFVLEASGVRDLNPMAGEPAFFADGHSRGTSSPLGFSEDGDVYAVVTTVPGPAPNSIVRSFESNITSGRLGAVQWFTDEALASILVNKLAPASGRLPQYYQVLLRVKYKDAVPVETSYVLHRELRTGHSPVKK